MKKGTLLMAIILMVMSVNVYAAENTTEISEMEVDVEAGQTGTGDKITPCTVTFCITDESNYPGNEIRAVMTDITGVMTDEYKFTPENSWGEKVCPKYSLMAPTTYNVIFEGLEEGYTIVNTLDYSTDIQIVTTSEGNIDVYWTIISTEMNGSEKDNADGSQLLGEDRYNAQNEEAEQVFRTFLDQVKFIAEDETWDFFFQRFRLFDYSEWYEKYVSGMKAEDYANMSLFDRFVWEDTYLSFCHYVNSGNRNMFLGSEENFRNYFLDSRINCMTGNNSEQVIAAYEELAMWQFNYINENGIPFNFINNRSYMEEINSSDEAPLRSEIIEKDESDLPDVDKKELVQESRDTIEITNDSNVEEESGGVWDDTINLISEKLVTIGILLLLLIATGIVIWKRKQLNIDNNDKY